MTAHDVTTVQLLRYSSLALPVAFAGFPLYVLAPDFYATQHGLSLTLLGIILLGLRIFDGIQDPLIGMLSDRYRQHTAGFMIVSAILLCISIYGLFNEIFGGAALWFACCMMVAVSSYSVLSINLNSLGALWTRDRNAQTRITTFRESFGLVGLLVAVSLPGLFISLVGNKDAFLWFSVALAGLMIISLSVFLPWLGTQADENAGYSNNSFSWSRIVQVLGAQKRLFGIYGLSILASSIPAVLVIFFVRDLLGAEHLIGVFLVIYFLAGALGMPLWKSLSEKYSKETAWLIATLLAIISFIWAFFLGAGDIWQYGLICFFSGLALGADLALPPSLLADRLHANHSQGHAAIQFSILALIAKACLAVASAIALPLLDSAGFQPKQLNSPDALLNLSIAYAAIPCALKLAAAGCLYLTSTDSNVGAIDEKISTNDHTGSSYHV